MIDILARLKNKNASKNSNDDFSQKLAKLKNYYSSIIKSLNQVSNSLTPYISFEMPSDDALNNLAGNIPNLEYFENGYEKIYPEQIRSSWQVIEGLVQGHSQEHVTGLTQLGKNGLITIVLDFLGIVAIANPTDPQHLLPVAWLPNAINMEQQSLRKFNESMKLNSIIKCKFSGTVVELGEFHKEMIDIIRPKIIEIIDSNNDSITMTTKLKESVNDFFGKNGVSALVLRRSVAKLKMYKWLFEGAHNTGGDIKIVLVMDESHIAIGRGQGADKTFEINFDIKKAGENFGSDDIGNSQGPDDIMDPDLDNQNELIEEVAEVEELINTFEAISKDQAKLVTISATNAPFSKLKYKVGDQPIYLEVGNHYCGFPFIDGRDYPLVIGNKIQQPIVKNIFQISEDIGKPELKFLDLRVLDSAEGYGRFIMDGDWGIISKILNENGCTVESNTGRGIGRIAKIIEDLKNSKARDKVALLEKIIKECTISEMLEDTEFKRLFSRKTVKERKTYLQTLSASGSSLFLGWEKAVKKAQKNLGDLFEYLLIKVNPSNKKGCIIRWECSNKSFDGFIKPLEKRFQNKICLIPYMGMSANKTVTEILKITNPDKLPYVIVVTGRGRYGESYPPDCGYAIDATTRPSTTASFAQSLLGRLTGYRKYDPKDPENSRPMLILSNSAYATVFEPWLKHKGNPPNIKISDHMVKVGNNTKVIELVRLNRGVPELEKMFVGLDNRAMIKKLNQSWKSIKEDLFINFISPVISLVESDPHKYVSGYPKDGPPKIKILKPGEADLFGRELDWWKRNKKKEEKRKPNYLTFFAFERYENDITKRFGLKSSRNERSGKEYLHTGLLVATDNKAKSVFLWLSEGVKTFDSNEQLSEYEVKEGSLPDKLS